MVILKKVEIFEFNPDHLNVIDIREEEAQGVMTLPDYYERFSMAAEKSIEANSYAYDGIMLFSAGYMELWPGVIECWMVPSIHVEKYKMTFCKLLKNYVDKILREQTCHRLQATAPDDELHNRWMGFLGLKKEGVMKQYTHTKQDYAIFGRTI